MNALSSFFNDHFFCTGSQLQKVCRSIVIQGVDSYITHVFLESVGIFCLNINHKSNRRLRYSIIQAPVEEELLFRIIIFGAFQCIQQVLHGNSKFQLASMVNEIEEQKDEKKDFFPIVIYPSLVEEVIWEGYVKGLDAMTAIANMIYDRIHISSSLNLNQPLHKEHFVFHICLPLEFNLLYSTCCKIATLFPSQTSVKISEQERKEKLFRVHFSALVFAGAHFLVNRHGNISDALHQFCSSYIGGIIYGHFREKSHSIAPAIIAHSLNNTFATLIDRHFNDDEEKFVWLIMIVNRIGTYLLAVV